MQSGNRVPVLLRPLLWEVDVKPSRPGSCVQSRTDETMTRSGQVVAPGDSSGSPAPRKVVVNLRALEVDVYAIAGTCTDAEVSADMCAFLVRSGLLDGGYQLLLRDAYVGWDFALEPTAPCACCALVRPCPLGVGLAMGEQR